MSTLTKVRRTTTQRKPSQASRATVTGEGVSLRNKLQAISEISIERLIQAGQMMRVNLSEEGVVFRTLIYHLRAIAKETGQQYKTISLEDNTVLVFFLPEAVVAKRQKG